MFYASSRIAGKTERVDRKIGTFGKLTVAEARKVARKYLVQMENGIDPHQDRIEASKQKSLTFVATEFLSNYVETKVKPRTADEYRRHISKEILPKLGRLKAVEIELKHLRQLHSELRETPVKANRVIATFSKLLSWAEGEGFREINSNPSSHVGKFKEEKRDRRLSKDEAAKLTKVLNQYQRTNPYYVALIKVILLTGARRDEIRTLKWEYVNFEHKQLELPDSKTGKKILPLGPSVIEILKTLYRQQGNPYVFCGFKVGRPIVNVYKTWVKLIAEAEIAHVTIHDLRRTYATSLLDQGAQVILISKLLGHKSIKTTERYLGVSQVNLRAASELAEVLIS